MSGWTHITIESNQSQVEDEVNRELVEKQIKNLKQIKNRDTSEPEKLLDKVVKQLEHAQIEAGTVNVEEKIGEWWKQKLEKDGGKYDELTYDPQTAKYGARGLGYEDSTETRKLVKEIMEECPYADRVLILSANDTSNSGGGLLYKRTEDSEPELVDEHQGYEGAKGYDSQGYFREEHNIKGKAWT